MHCCLRPGRISILDCKRFNYSDRNARTGLVFVARHAGTRLAAIATTIITANAMANVSGSRGLTL